MPTKTKYVPNSVLPKGAVLLKRRVRKNVGGWVEMEYDARIERLGLTWWRAYGGFSGIESNHPREDWCAELPSGCLNVSNDDWDGSASFGYEHKTLYKDFDAAVIGETKGFLDRAERAADAAIKDAETRKATVKAIRAAIGLAMFDADKAKRSRKGRD